MIGTGRCPQLLGKTEQVCLGLPLMRWAWACKKVITPAVFNGEAVACRDPLRRSHLAQVAPSEEETTSRLDSQIHGADQYLQRHGHLARMVT